MNPDVSKADPARSSALLIGNKNYPNSALPVFPAAEDNLAALGNAFRDPKLWGLRGRRLSVDHDLERADFLDSVRLTARSSEHGGLLVLYFAGHAEKDSGMLYLAPSDGDPADPANSMISVAEIFRAVGQETGAASRKLLILDCCYAGQAVRAMPTEPVPVGDAQGWLIMAATAPTATALAHPERTHSLFTAALLEAFKGAPEASRGLSPRWISERVDALIPELEEESKRLKPYTSNAGWMDDPWLHNRSYSERRRTPYVAPTLGNDAPPSKLPNGFPSWPTQEPLYIGRAEELRQAQERLRQRSVLSITGPRYAGKAAFVRQLLAMPKMPESGPTEQPWLLMEIAVINPSAESPVLEAMAKALEVRLQDGGQGLDTGRDSRRELIMERLREHTRGRTLLLVIDCGRLGYDSQRVTAELDELLEDPYFRDTANVVISRVTLMVDGDEQLDRQPEIRLQELADEEAAKLLTTLLARRKITVDGTSVLAQIGDRRMRLPGVLTTSAAGFPGGESQDAPEPADVASALLEGSARSVAKTLDEFGCRIGPEPKPSTPQQLAVLMVWALADHLAFPATVLEDPAIGIGRRLLLLLEDARVIFKIGNGWLEIGEVSKQALRSLLLTALKRDQDAEDPLSPRPLAFELKKLFAPEMDTRGLDSALTLAASALFLTALDPRKADDEVLNPAVLHGARWAIGWIEDEIDGGLPLLRRRLQTFVLAPAGDELFLPSKLTEPETEQAALAAGVSPVEDQEPVTTSLLSLFRLYQAVTALTLAARATSTLERVSADFVAAAEDFSAALATCQYDQIPHSLLRSADASMALTGVRLALTGRLLDVRRSVAPTVLEGAGQKGPGQAGRITLAISWILNTTDALIDTGDLAAAQEMVETAQELVGNLPDYGSVRSTHTRLQLLSRIARVRSRLQTDQAERWGTLRAAAQNAAQGLELAHESNDSLSLWSRRLLEAGVLLMQQSSGDDQLMHVAAFVTGALERSWGERDSWPPQIRIATADLLNRVYLRCSNPDRRLKGTQETILMLLSMQRHLQENAMPQPAGGIVSTANVELARLLVSLARAHGFLAYALSEKFYFSPARARAFEAEEYARKAVELNPSAATYSAWLRHVADLHSSTPRTGKAGQGSEQRLRSCIKTIRQWLQGQDTNTRQCALLDLNCLRTEWVEEGSLRSACQEPGEDFLWLPSEVKKERIDSRYKDRLHKLAAHRYRYGDSVELCIQESRLKREYVRWSGILDFALRRKKGLPRPVAPQVDNGPVFEVFARAEALSPGSFKTGMAKTDFLRYVWRDSQAVDGYEHLARIARNGEDWRQAKLAAAEAIMASVEHTGPKSPVRRVELLRRAQRHLDPLTGHNRYSERAAVLREQLAFMLGEAVDWERIDASFESIIGGDYAGTVGRYLDRRHRSPTEEVIGLSGRIRIVHSGRVDTPQQRALQELFARYGADPSKEEETSSGGGGKDDHKLAGSEKAGGNVADLLLIDFTSVELLKGMGKLYLVRADSLEGEGAPSSGLEVPGSSERAAECAKKAYDCFDACRVMQEAHGNESVVIKFLRGRAILAAVAHLHDPDPFPWLGRRSGETLLEEGERLLWSAMQGSVGGFNKVCKDMLRESRRRKKELGF